MIKQDGLHKLVDSLFELIQQLCKYVTEIERIALSKLVDFFLSLEKYEFSNYLYSVIGNNGRWR